MTTFSRSTLSLATGALLLLPVSLVGATETCSCGAPTEESYTWNFPQEGTTKLEAIQVRSDIIRRDADRLVAYAELMNGSGTRGQNWKLTKIRDRVNEVSKKFCRLQLIDHTLDPWQQSIVKRLKPEVNALARNTETAILISRDERTQDRLRANETYQQSVKDIYQQADKISDMVSDSLRYREAFGTGARAGD